MNGRTALPTEARTAPIVGSGAKTAAARTASIGAAAHGTSGAAAPDRLYSKLPPTVTLKLVSHLKFKEVALLPPAVRWESFL